MGNLSHSGSDLVIKAPFKVDRKSLFNIFDGRERIETIDIILRKEIDFENFVLQGVIQEHFPLHKQEPLVFKELFEKSKWKLMRGFVTGNFHEHFVSINYMKMYYGEKIAFEFAFLMHYQAWLLIPTVTGVLLTFYQGYVW